MVALQRQPLKKVLKATSRTNALIIPIQFFGMAQMSADSKPLLCDIENALNRWKRLCLLQNRLSWS
jgi:hypothetical protein